MATKITTDPFAADPIPGQTTVEEQERDALAELEAKVEAEMAAEESTRGVRTANQRYSAAQRALRDLYPADFLHFLRVEYEKDGLEYKPRLSAEERAEVEREEKRRKAEEKIAALQAEIEALG